MKITKRLLRLLALAVTLAVFAAACSSSDGDGEDTGTETESDGDGDGDGDTASAGGTLQKVTDAGTLECGGNDTLPGFGNVDENGEFSGFDIDFCKVVAAAVLGDSEALNVTPLVPAERFTTLQSGEVDILIRNTTATASRDGSEQANFLHTLFYDGQGFLVRNDSGIEALADMSNANICVLTGTTTLLNLNAKFADEDIPFTPVEFESNEELQPAFIEGQCEVWTSDASQLAAFAAEMDVETNILSDIISKEPLGPAVADGDTEWAQVVNWAVMSTIQAWEFGITSENIDEFVDSENSDIRRFLGEEVEQEEGEAIVEDVGLGLDPKFAYNVVSQVGNYQEIYERNITPIGLPLEGSPNDLWTNGGLQYVPPYR